MKSDQCKQIVMAIFLEKPQNYFWQKSWKISLEGPMCIAGHPVHRRHPLCAPLQSAADIINHDRKKNKTIYQTTRGLNWQIEQKQKDCKTEKKQFLTMLLELLFSVLSHCNLQIRWEVYFDQGLTGRVFQLRVGSGSGIGKSYRVGSGLGLGSGIGIIYLINRVLKFLIGSFPILSYLTLGVLG